MPAVEQSKLTPEALRESLQDVITIVEAMSSHCGSLAELQEVCQLALGNDTQLSLLLGAMASFANKRK